MRPNSPRPKDVMNHLTGFYFYYLSTADELCFIMLMCWFNTKKATLCCSFFFFLTFILTSCSHVAQKLVILMLSLYHCVILHFWLRFCPSIMAAWRLYCLALWPFLSKVCFQNWILYFAGHSQTMTHGHSRRMLYTDLYQNCEYCHAVRAWLCW